MKGEIDLHKYLSFVWSKTCSVNTYRWALDRPRRGEREGRGKGEGREREGREKGEGRGREGRGKGERIEKEGREKGERRERKRRGKGEGRERDDFTVTYIDVTAALTEYIHNVHVRTVVYMYM